MQPDKMTMVWDKVREVVAVLFFHCYVVSPPGSSVHGISQARILEWVAISISRGSSWTRGQSCTSCIGRRVLHHWVAWEALGGRHGPYRAGPCKPGERVLSLFHQFWEAIGEFWATKCHHQSSISKIPPWLISVCDGEPFEEMQSKREPGFWHSFCLIPNPPWNCCCRHHQGPRTKLWSQTAIWRPAWELLDPGASAKTHLFPENSPRSSNFSNQTLSSLTLKGICYLI